MEGKRRLPQWSLGGASKVLNTKNGDDGMSSMINPEKSNAKVSGKVKEGGESTVKKCRRAGRKKKKEVSEQDEISCAAGIDVEDDSAKEKRRTRRGGVGRMKEVSDCAPRLKKCRVNEIEPSSPVEDDNGDLTMEDLIAIAKEFAGDDNATSLKQAFDGEEVESIYADTIISRSEKPSPRFAETASSHRHSAEETETIIEPRMTGDPAQDMLDVFLGPLLNTKPLWNEKKTDLTSDEDMVLAREVENRQRNPVVVGDATIQLTKKKTSLKDKVASLLAE